MGRQSPRVLQFLPVLHFMGREDIADVYSWCKEIRGEILLRLHIVEGRPGVLGGQETRHFPHMFYLINQNLMTIALEVFCR